MSKLSTINGIPIFMNKTLSVPPERTGKDLGTYHVKIEFHNARGYIRRYRTGLYFSPQTAGVSPLDATPHKPRRETEEELVREIVSSYVDGNYSCDCNLKNDIADAHGEPRPDAACSENIKLKRLTLIKPDLTEEVIWDDATSKHDNPAEADEVQPGSCP